MKTLIFEGIATSGKSTVIDLLIASLQSRINIRHASEAETHIPIILDTDDLHLGFFDELIKKLCTEDPELLIFDRLYLTQAFRAKVNLRDYESIEDYLKPYSPTTIFLKVSPDNIEERIEKAASHRESKWAEYIKTKGKTVHEIAQYYIDQQNNQLKLLKESALPYQIFDTTDHKYKDITEKIIKLINIIE